MFRLNSSILLAFLSPLLLLGLQCPQDPVGPDCTLPKAPGLPPVPPDEYDSEGYSFLTGLNKLGVDRLLYDRHGFRADPKTGQKMSRTGFDASGYKNIPGIGRRTLYGHDFAGVERKNDRTPTEEVAGFDPYGNSVSLKISKAQYFSYLGFDAAGYRRVLPFSRPGPAGAEDRYDKEGYNEKDLNFLKIKRIDSEKDGYNHVIKANLIPEVGDKLVERFNKECWPLEDPIYIVSPVATMNEVMGIVHQKVLDADGNPTDKFAYPDYGNMTEGDVSAYMKKTIAYCNFLGRGGTGTLKMGEGGDGLRAIDTLRVNTFHYLTDRVAQLDYEVAYNDWQEYFKTNYNRDKNLWNLSFCPAEDKITVTTPANAAVGSAVATVKDVLCPAGTLDIYTTIMRAMTDETLLASYWQEPDDGIYKGGGPLNPADRLHRSKVAISNLLIAYINSNTSAVIGGNPLFLGRYQLLQTAVGIHMETTKNQLSEIASLFKHGGLHCPDAKRKAVEYGHPLANPGDYARNKSYLAQIQGTGPEGSIRGTMADLKSIKLFNGISSLVSGVAQSPNVTTAGPPPFDQASSFGATWDGYAESLGLEKIGVANQQFLLWSVAPAGRLGPGGIPKPPTLTAINATKTWFTKPPDVADSSFWAFFHGVDLRVDNLPGGGYVPIMGNGALSIFRALDESPFMADIKNNILGPIQILTTPGRYPWINATLLRFGILRLP